MSGGFVPYNLRQNKAIERAVFIDLLTRLSRSTKIHIKDYLYLGFAGPFSEDFKLAHSALGIRKMISLEKDAQVLKRQRWNTPIACIDFVHQGSRQFLDGFQPNSPFIGWLDFTSASDVSVQLDQLELLTSKAAAYDVVKITLNANEKTLEPVPRPESEEDFLAAMAAEAHHRIGDFLPGGQTLTDEDLDREGYPKLLLAAIENAVKSGLQGNPGHYFQPLCSFVYADSEQQMLTHTGIVLPDTVTSATFLAETGVHGWSLATTKWGVPRTNPVRISVPEMSVRERLHIDQRLPTKSPSQISRSLGIRLVNGADEKTVRALASYKLFYRHFPFFSRVLV